MLALNSYENRVYQVGIEDKAPLIAKFYRPERWTNAQILEEHAFSFELAECEVPLVAPMQHNGQSLFEHAGFRFALFERRGGRAPEPGNLDQLYRLGQLLGRLHAVGANKPFRERPELNVQSYGHASFQRLCSGEHVPKAYVPLGSRWRVIYCSRLRMCLLSTRIHRFECTVIVIRAICCAAMKVSLWSILMIVAPGRRSRICG